MSGVDIEQLVEAAAGRDERAWQRLWVSVEPALTRLIAKPRFLGALGGCEDDRRSIIVATMGKLRDDDFARLRNYVAARQANPRLCFMGWLCVVAKRIGIDYMRAHPDYLRRCSRERSRPGTWVRASPLPQSHLLGRRPPATARLTARRILDGATTLPAEQRQALVRWAQGDDFVEIARELGLVDARAAERAVRAALDRLRRAHRE